jgi:Uma2 family endonuclease
VINPLLIVEVLSPSTERDDVFIKLPAYQQIASLQEIVYVETERVGATVYRRAEDEWQDRVLSAPHDRLQLHSVGVDIELGRLYRGIPGLMP